MKSTIIPREQAAEKLAVSPQLLIRYEARGLIQSTQQGDVIGYEPFEIKRIWSIVTFQRDLGVNLAGVETILRLRDHVDELHHQLNQFSLDLRAALDDRDDAETLPDED